MNANVLTRVMAVTALIIGGVALWRTSPETRLHGAEPPESNAAYGAPKEDGPLGPVVLERISAAVPWPRGVQWKDGKLYALARGIHRSAGGPQADIEDHAGSIFEVDPTISQPADNAVPFSEAVASNGKIFAAADGTPFRVWNRQMPATRDTLADRPYCALIWDDASKNFFLTGYSGIDLPGGAIFRKNATDSVLRFDTRVGQWHSVEAHDPTVVPEDALGIDVSSEYYPHHDVTRNAPPHGLVNGPCGSAIAGDFLYVAAKDNSALAQYDLREIRKNPAAPAPPGRYVFEGSKGHASMPVEGHGDMILQGPAALTVRDGWLYVAFRTTSQIIRMRLTDNGDVQRPYQVQYIAQFQRYEPEKGKGSANIYDIVFDEAGRLYVSPGYDGAIYRFWPDPKRVYDATDGYAGEPYVDLTALVGARRTGNICFDDEGNLYICTGDLVLENTKRRGVIYRLLPRDLPVAKKS